MVKNVLLLTPFAPPNIGGVETHIEDYYNFLAEEGYKTTVLTYQPLTSKIRGLSVEKHKNLTIHRYDWIGYNLFPFLEKMPPIFNFLYLTPYLLIRSVFFMIKNHKSVDVIHAFGLNCAFIARTLRIFFRKNIYVSMEALYGFDRNNFFGKVCSWVFNGFHTVLVGSEQSRDDVLNLGVDKDKILIYTHWIDLKIFQPGNKKSLKKKLGWRDSFTVIYIGRLVKIKGISVFLDIAKHSRLDMEFKIIGDGTEIEKVKNAARQQKNIQYLGRIPNAETAKYYAAADVLVYPALYDEDLSLVLLESLACGTPVINTNKGSGIYQLDNSFAYVVKPDAKIIVQKLEILHKSPVLRNNMSKAGIAFASQFGIELARIITNAYEKEN